MLESLLNKFTEKGLNIKQSEWRNILILSLSILRVQTVCLNKLKGTVGQIIGNERTKPASNYQRLLRIFHKHAFSRLWLDILGFVFQLLRLKCEHLVIDGTSWKRGEKWYNYIVLSVVYKSVSIPIYWMNLSKQGISSEQERKQFLKRVLRSFTLANKTLLADREYIGLEWFKFLIARDLDFVIRLRKNTYYEAINAAAGKSVQQMIDKVKRSKLANKSVKKNFEMDGMQLCFVVTKNRDPKAEDELLFLISNQVDSSAAYIAEQYSIRWTIEHCFKQLKSNGFDMEAMNLRGKARQNLMLAIVVFTYVLSILEGLKTYHTIPVKTDKQGRTTKAVSLFRHGTDYLVILTASLQRFIQYINTQFDILRTAYRSPMALNV